MVLTRGRGLASDPLNERLRLREFRESDLDALAPMVGDPEPMTFLARPKTRAEASEWIQGNRTLYEEHGFGFWLIELAPRPGFAGYCGIRPLDLERVSEIEIGWHVNQRFWGQGIATQAATIARDAAVSRFGISRRVAEKVGMHEERTTMLEEDYPAVVYATGPKRAP